MERKYIEQHVKTILCVYGADANVLCGETSFGSPELSLSSVIFMTAMVEIENRFEIALELQQVWSGETRRLGDLIDYIDDMLQRES